MRFCPNCGTEVDESAAFCPTCGQAIDQAAETAMPAAPAWPDPAAPASAEPERQPAAPAAADPALTQQRQPVPPPPPPASPVPADPGGPTVDVPLTVPVTLSAWLIGIGALIGALGLVIGLFDGTLNLVELVLLLALVGVIVGVFFSDAVSGVPNLRLATLVAVLIGFGIALDRIAIGEAGVGELLLFLGTAAAAMGAIILELGRDQPLGPPR